MTAVSTLMQQMTFIGFTCENFSENTYSLRAYSSDGIYQKYPLYDVKYYTTHNILHKYLHYNMRFNSQTIMMW